VSPFHAHPEGTEVVVWVVPGASRTEVAGLHDGALRVRVAAPPEGGKANKAVVRLISAKTGGRVRLLSGTASRRKRLLIEGKTPREAAGSLLSGAGS